MGGAADARLRASGSVVLTTNYARTARQFRGHLIRELISRRMPVFVLAPDYDEGTRAQVSSLGAEPVDVSMQRTGLNPLRDCADLFSLAGKLRRLGAAVEFSFGAKAVVQGTLAACLAGIKSRYAMIEGVGCYFREGGEADAVGRKFVRRLIEGLYWLVLRFNSRVFFLN